MISVKTKPYVIFMSMYCKKAIEDNNWTLKFNYSYANKVVDALARIGHKQGRTHCILRAIETYPVNI